MCEYFVAVPGVVYKFLYLLHCHHMAQYWTTDLWHFTKFYDEIFIKPATRIYVNDS